MNTGGYHSHISRHAEGLLFFASSAASARERGELANCIITCLRPLLHFDYATVVVFDPASGESDVLLTSRGKPESAIKGAKLEQSVAQWLINHPSKLIIQDQAGSTSGPGLASEAGELYHVICKLDGEGPSAGFLLLHYAEPQKLDAGLEACLAYAAEHIGIAAQRILYAEEGERRTANEDIKHREREKTLQIALVDALTGANTWPERFLRMGRAFTSAFDWHLMSFAFNNRTLPGTTVIRKSPSGEAELYPIAEGLADYGLTQQEAILLHKQVEEDYGVPKVFVGEVYGKACEQNALKRLGRDVHGHRSSLHFPLQIGEHGYLRIVAASRNEFAYTESDLKLLQRISGLVCLAVQKSLALEDIQLREREKDLHIAIVDALTQEPTWERRFSRIAGILATIFDWHIASFGFDEEPPEKNVTFRRGPDGGIAVYPLEALMTDYNLSRTQIFRLNMEIAGFYRAPAFFVGKAYVEESERNAGKAVGRRIHNLKSSINVPLPVGNKGYLRIIAASQEEFAYTQQHLELLMKLSSSVSLAVAKVIAFEQIQQREKEKELLLKLSSSFSRLNRKEELLPALRKQVSEVLEYDYAVIALVDSKSRRYAALITDAAGQTLASCQRAAGDYSCDDGLFGEVVTAGAPVLVDVESAAKKYPAACYLKDLMGAGIREMMCAPLRSTNENLGIIYLESKRESAFGRETFSLFQAVSEQVAATLANLLANENSAAREREKANQIAVMSAVSETRDWKDRMLQLTRLFHAHVPLHYADYVLEVKGTVKEHWGYRRIGTDEYQVISADSFLTIFNLTPKHWKDLHSQSDYPAGIGIMNSIGAEGRSPGIPSVIMTGFGLAHSVTVVIPVDRHTRLIIQIFSKDISYTEAHRTFFAPLVPTIAASFERMMMFEQIEELKDKLQIEKEYLEQEIKTSYNFEEIIGTSGPMQNVFQKISMVAGTDATVMIQGETGTGKELIARAIHNLSPRRNKVFIKVNCAALPSQLIESELFGHERGAFTGAIQQRIGKFEAANGGTLFLDEVGEIPLEIQAKLLRALQEKEIERVGGKGPIACDVRIVAATNRLLEEEVRAGRFRSDLYFRLNVFPVDLPPLRQRVDDIQLLARHFLHKYAKQYGKTINAIPTGVTKELEAYDWPGNVRELEHLIQQSIIQTTGSMLELSRTLKRTARRPLSFHGEEEVKTWAEAERDNILKAIRLANGKIRGKGGAAELLDIHPNTLDSRMKKLGIRKTHFYSQDELAGREDPGDLTLLQ